MILLDGSGEKVFDHEVLESCALITGDNLEILKGFPTACVDLVYLDPPFFTRNKHSLRERENGRVLSFDDVWCGHDEYLAWMKERLIQLRRVLKDTASIYLHCDWHASHLLRVVLDEVFHPQNFRAEIVWVYRRWTNSLRSFQRSHQVIYFYSKTKNYKFNVQHEDYSFTTNIDQIWQKRARDDNGTCITPKVGSNYVPLRRAKPGVPMRDVWEIPYLNPKARERTGYPTQKPVELLLRIVSAATDVGDIVLDPFCGSGTTLVAAKMLRRRCVGIDSSHDAIRIATTRLQGPSKAALSVQHYTPFRLSAFLKLSRDEKIRHIAKILDMNIAYRNKDIDGFLRNVGGCNNVAFRFVEEEDVKSAISSFAYACSKRDVSLGLVMLPRVDKRERKALENHCPRNPSIRIVSYEDLLKARFQEILPI